MPVTPVQRHLPTEEATELLALTRELAREELAPKVAADEAESRFPREVFRTLGKAGLLGLPYPEEHGGGGQPYEVYLQVVEELASRLGHGRRGRQRAHPGLLPAGRVTAPTSSATAGCRT